MSATGRRAPRRAAAGSARPARRGTAVPAPPAAAA